MTAKYIYLLSRNLTEKEAVARRNYSQQSKINDDIVSQKLPFSTCVKNIWKNLVRKHPKSVLAIAKRMRSSKHIHHETTDNHIDGMNPPGYDSSSSSSDDELPEFLRPKPLNVMYANNPNVLIVGADGKVIQQVSQEQFMKSNPNFAASMNWNRAVPLENNTNGSETSQNPVSPPSVPPQPVDGQGGFSDKYKEKLEKHKHESQS